MSQAWSLGQQEAAPAGLSPANMHTSSAFGQQAIPPGVVAGSPSQAAPGAGQQASSPPLLAIPRTTAFPAASQQSSSGGGPTGSFIYTLAFSQHFPVASNKFPTHDSPAGQQVSAGVIRTPSVSQACAGSQHPSPGTPAHG